MSADIIQHPGVVDLRNARNRACWLERYYSGVHYADLRTPELYRRGEWIALQAAWLRRGYRFGSARAYRAAQGEQSKTVL